MTDYEAKDHYQNNQAAERYARQFHERLSPSSFRAQWLGGRESRAFKSLLDKTGRDEMDILDIASGTGRYVELMLDAGHRAGGVDISDEMLDFARDRLGSRENLKFFKRADAEALPFEDSSFDLVTCMRLFHRIPPENRMRMLQEVKRVGRGQAILFFGIVTPWLRVRRKIRARLIPGRHSNPYPHTFAQLAEDLNKTGMEMQHGRWVMPLFAEGYLTHLTW
jgi:ubiquinone/menaquinone biosynthesis C-methylase UbiE